MYQILLLFSAIFLSSSTFAQETSLDFSIHQEYTSTRALGMGNAFTAVADDHSSLFYNPATLALRKDGNIRLFLRAGIDPDYPELLDDIEKADGDENEMTEVLQDNYGKHYYSRVPTVGAVWVRPKWGIAFIPADLSTDLAIHRQIGPSLNVNAYLDSTLAYGRAKKWKFGWGKFALGGTLKAIHRVYYGDVVSAGELIQDSEIFRTEDADEGLTTDLDIGTMFIPNVPDKGFFSFLKLAKPQFAIVMRNAADYGFTTNFNMIDDESGQPPDLQRRLDFGSKFDLPNFWAFDPHVAIDVRDVLHDNWNLQKGFHAGAELYWTMANWWKGYWSLGINQGYPSFGFGARFAWFNIDIATWGEEVGTENAQVESRRVIVETSLDF